MECSYEVEVVAYVDFTDEEFTFMEKSMQEHPDMAMFIEYGTWFYGIKKLRETNARIPARLTSRQILLMLRSLEKQQGEYAMSFFGKLKNIFFSMQAKRGELNSKLKQETLDFSLS